MQLMNLKHHQHHLMQFLCSISYIQMLTRASFHLSEMHKMYHDYPQLHLFHSYYVHVFLCMKLISKLFLNFEMLQILLR